MSEKFMNPEEIFGAEPKQTTEQTQSKGKVSTLTKPIQFDLEKKEIIILASEGKEEKRHPFQEVLYRLRDEGVPASTGEWIDLQTLLDNGEVQSLDELYIVARAVLVKDVTNYPKYDNVFGEMFYGIEPSNPNEEEEKDCYDDSAKGKQEDVDGDKTEKTKGELEEIEQKKQENVKEVAEATSKTSENVHGGQEATKDIEDSPNPANEGKDKDNKGAEKGVEGTEGEGQEGEGGENKSRKAKLGEGGEKQSGMGSESKENLEETKEQVKDKKKKGYGSTKELILERKYDKLGENRTLGYENFGRALSKLRGILQETTPTRTRTLDAKATAQSISMHGGAPELLWKEEVEKKPNVVLMFDVGGSTDNYRPILEQLFTAAKDELEGLDVYYFHNIILGGVWPQKDGNYGKHFISIQEIMKRDPSTKVIIVGDAQMGYNESYGGLHDTCEDIYPDWYDPSDPYHNKTGIENVISVTKHFDNVVWLWVPPWGTKESREEIIQEEYDYSGDSTIYDIQEYISMHDLTLKGLEKAVKELMTEK